MSDTLQFEVINRTINLPPTLKDVAVQGDTNSKIIYFSINRYFDGVDLSGKTIKIAFMNSSNKSGYNDAKLTEIGIDTFTFEWAIQGDATKIAGDIQISVEFSSTDIKGNKTYIWKTKPKSFTIESSFSVIGNATQPDYMLQKAFVLNNDNNSQNEISDSNEPITISDRNILIYDVEDMVVSGDARSQIISFTIPRYFQNIDLSTKIISIKFSNANNKSDRSPATNVVTTDDTISFGWLLDGNVTIKDGTVSFAIEFLGYDENNDFYCWSTIPSQFKVEKGLNVDTQLDDYVPTLVQSWEADKANFLIAESDVIATAVDGYIDSKNTELDNKFQVKYDNVEQSYSTALAVERARINQLLNGADTYYKKCLSTDTGALLVVASGATTGQINLASVTPVLSGYTPAVGDYVHKLSDVLLSGLNDIKIGANGTTYASPGDAVRGQYNKLKEDLVDLCKIENVEFNTTSEALKYVEDDYEFSNFNLALEDKLLNGYSISAQGKRVENATWSIYDYKIYVGSNSKVYTNQTISGQNGSITLSFYDENDTFISRTMLDLQLSPKITDIPENTYYFICARTNTSTPTTIISFEKTDWSTKYVEGKIVSKVSKDVSKLHKTSGKKLRICILGDLHSVQEGGGSFNGSWIGDSSITGMTADERMQFMIDNILKLHNENPFDFILCTGDVTIEKDNHTNVDFNNPINLKYFCDKFKSQIPIPFMSCVGNHDAFTNDDWLKYMGTPRQYSFETDDYYFIMLDTFSDITPTLSGGIYGLNRTAIDMNFVNSEIAKAGDKKIIICGHYFTSDDTELKTVCQNNDNIIAVFMGHSHVYNITKSTSNSFGENTTIYMTNNFCYPETKWDGLPQSHSMWLWSIGIVEIAENTLKQKEIYPAHNYVGIPYDFKGLETDWYSIENVEKNSHADFYIPTYNPINTDFVRMICDLGNRVKALEIN